MADQKVTDLTAATTLAATDLLPVVLPNAAAGTRNRKMTTANAGKALAAYQEFINANAVEVGSTNATADGFQGHVYHANGTGGRAAIGMLFAAGSRRAVFTNAYQGDDTIWTVLGTGEVVARDFDPAESVLTDGVRAYAIGGEVRLWRATEDLNPLDFGPSFAVPTPGDGPEWEELSPDDVGGGAAKHFLTWEEYYDLLDVQNGGSGQQVGALYAITNATGPGSGDVIFLAISPTTTWPKGVRGNLFGTLNLTNGVFTPAPDAIYQEAVPLADFQTRAAAAASDPVVAGLRYLITERGTDGEAGPPLPDVVVEVLRAPGLTGATLAPGAAWELRDTGAVPGTFDYDTNVFTLADTPATTQAYVLADAAPFRVPVEDINALALTDLTVELVAGTVTWQNGSDFDVIGLIGHGRRLLVQANLLTHRSATMTGVTFESAGAGLILRPAIGYPTPTVTFVGCVILADLEIAASVTAVVDGGSLTGAIGGAGTLELRGAVRVAQSLLDAFTGGGGTVLDNRCVVTSPDGTVWRVLVDNTGALSTVAN